MGLIEVRINATEQDAKLLKKILRDYMEQCRSQKELIVCDNSIELIEYAELQAAQRSNENG